MLLSMKRDGHELLLTVLAENIKAFRLENQLSQEELAGRAELDRTYVSQLERAKCNPSLLVLSKVADSLGVGVVDLLR